MGARRKRQRPLRHAAKTALLVVGEGPDDQAFIKHMNRVFRDDSTGIRATVQKESGGSPENIIANTLRKYKNGAYERRFIVLDSDVPVSDASQKEAEKKGYTLILWAPLCLEGALLDVLGESFRPGETSQSMKDRLHPRLKAHHTEPEAYEDLFPKPVLADTTNESVVSVRKALTGQK
ncbi:hypothetical protein [Saccharospirillum salsuginis]|uniref:RloB-like protein n=1 Tax=Saccharospirillum salsuginis TaxID=418750 RepID=A0A918K407_9GAMM|nr:hypothetical protein [Saccharospirillum salsuginis]GGX46266.1 hypothetical protein GCM10007392_11670 [Saccharospirillum salsuginis]